MKPNELRKTVEIAAGKIYYPQCIQYIRETMTPEFHDLAQATLPYYLPSQILSLKTKEERLKAIQSIPRDAVPKHTRQLVETGVKAMWKKRGI